MLEQAGYKALFVGGCVRNSLLGVPVADIDLATDAVPQRVLELAEDAGIKAIPTGIDHGTVTLVVDAVPVEVTTFRRDVATDGRRAVVAFSQDVFEDAQRRDFTMNALYCDRTGRVLDPLGGLPDLEARRLRFVGEARDRVAEDYLRILRFFRFHAYYGGDGMDAVALDACAWGAEGLNRVSAERIGSEMLKLLAAPDPTPSLAAMVHTGVLPRVLPGARAEGVGPLVHLYPVTDAILRLAALGGQDPDTKLRLSRVEAQRLEAIVSAAASSAELEELAYRYGAKDGLAALALRLSGLESPMPADAEARAQAASEAVFPIKARDLMPALSGAALGAQLKSLEEDWIASGFSLSRKELMARVETPDLP
ncbi:MAG: CCA tRNA nucleotidyltransferase [Pseudomonadota bacterium]